MRQIHVLMGVAFFASLHDGAFAGDDWPQFRGPTGDGVVVGADIPTEWGPTKNLAWKTALPGAGWSQPIVCGEQVFVTTATTDNFQKTKPKGGSASDLRLPINIPKPPDVVYRWELLVIDLKTGAIRSQTVIAEQKPLIPTHASNTFASETPATDGERVYVHIGSIGKLIATDFAGQTVWSVDVGAYRIASGLGTGSSVAVADGRVYVQCDNEDQSFLVAFDGATGKELWRTERRRGTSWSTPVLWRTPDRLELIACGRGHAAGYDPATGKNLWTLTGISSSFSASPAFAAGKLFFGSGGPLSDSPLFAVEPGITGEVAAPKTGDKADGVAWARKQSGPGLASLAAVGDYVYVTDGGVVKCFDAKTGEPVYKDRLPQAKLVVASPLVVGDKLYFFDETGRSYVVAAGPKFTLLGVNQLDDVFWASPAVAGKSLLLRGVEVLYCVRQ